MQEFRAMTIAKRKYVFGAGIIISAAYLMFYYRNVGLHDGFVYIQAGRDIANGDNPYSEGITRSGTVSSLILYCIYLLIPKLIAAETFQVMNLSLVAWFIWVLKGKKWKTEDYFLAVLVSFWLSPVRELLAINQVDAFVVGLLGTIIWINSKHHIINTQVKNALVSLNFALAIDLKPHLLLVVLVVWVILERSFSIILWTVAIFTVLHVAIDLYVREITEITWISRVLDVKDTASTTELGDSVTIWPIFQKLFPHWIGLVPVIAMLLFLTASALAIYFAIKNNANLAILISLVAPGVYIYFHFYDMIPLVLIYVAYLIHSTISSQHITLLCLLLIPKEFTSLKNLALVVLISTLVWLHSRHHPKPKRQLILGFVGYGILCAMNSVLFDGPRLTQSIFVTEIMFFILWANLRIASKKDSEMNIFGRV